MCSAQQLCHSKAACPVISYYQMNCSITQCCNNGYIANSQQLAILGSFIPQLAQPLVTASPFPRVYIAVFTAVYASYQCSSAAVDPAACCIVWLLLAVWQYTAQHPSKWSRLFNRLRRLRVESQATFASMIAARALLPSWII